MGYNTALAKWPSLPVPDAVKQHLDKFFSIMDMNALGAGDILAEEIFTMDGIIEGHHRAQGTEAIRRSRDNAWKLIDSRRHEVIKVYIDSVVSEDLLIIGQVTVGYENGEKKRGEFIARVRLSEAQTNSPKIKLYQVWMDASAMIKVD